MAAARRVGKQLQIMRDDRISPYQSRSGEDQLSFAEQVAQTRGVAFVGAFGISCQGVADVVAHLGDVHSDHQSSREVQALR